MGAIAILTRALRWRFEFLRLHARQYQLQSHFSFAFWFSLALSIPQFYRLSNSHTEYAPLTNRE